MYKKLIKFPFFILFKVAVVIIMGLSPAHGTFYVGGSLGAVIGNITLKRIETIPTVPLQDKSNLGGVGVLARVFSGYEYNFSPKIGVHPEISFAFSSLDSKSETKLSALSQQTLSMCPKESFAGNLRVHWLLNDFSPFLRMGVASQSWHIASKSGVLPLYKTLNKKTSGLCVGFGYTYKISSCISLGMEFVHAHYQAIKFTHENSAVIKLLPKTNEFLLSLKYAFS